MADQYRNFDELRRAERVGPDYVIREIKRQSDVAIIAPHGGWIEPGSSEVSEAIAGDDLNLYLFEGVRNRPHGDLHVTSTRFDEPTCLALIAACDTVLAVHGLEGREELVDIGGRDAALRDAVSHLLAEAGFNAKVVTTGGHAAISRDNICNRGRSGAGVQLELSRRLRDVLKNDVQKLKAFADAVRSAIEQDS